MQLGILIDFHNLFMMLKKSRHDTVQAIGEIMKMGRHLGTIGEARLFIPIYLYDSRVEEPERMWPWINELAQSFGLKVEGCVVSKRTTGDLKDFVDQHVLQFVMNHVHKDIGPEKVVFVTGDGDYGEFAAEAENRGKSVEFWSVDPLNTSRFIRQKKSFREIDVPSADSPENPFVVALNKKLKHLDLSEEEQRLIELIGKIPGLNLADCPVDEMELLISQQLGTPFPHAQQLVEMLIAVGVAEVKLTIQRVVSIDQLHIVFSTLE